VRHLALLTAVYAVVAVIALPGTLSASQDPVPREAARAAAAQAGSSHDAESQSPGAGPPSPAAAGEGEPGGGGEAGPAGGQAEPAAAAEPVPDAGADQAPGTAAPVESQSAPGAQQPSPAPAVGSEPADGSAAAARSAADTEAAESRAGRDERERVRLVASAAASSTVTIRNFAFSPESVTIDVGDTVTWTNQDSVEHSATADDGSFDTDLLADGESGSHTFEEAGTFQYFCKPHPNMKGTITVRVAGSGGGGSDSGAVDSGSSTGSGSSGDSSTGSTGSGSGSSGSGSTSTLPNTGADPATLAILGLLMLALGAAVQRRAHGGGSEPRSRVGR
jgi:LPXTG-motif cell wall-anchored protein